VLKLRDHYRSLMSQYEEDSPDHEAVRNADREVKLFFILISQVIVIEFGYQSIIKNAVV
jgi:hypothetical protein